MYLWNQYYKTLLNIDNIIWTQCAGARRSATQLCGQHKHVVGTRGDSAPAKLMKPVRHARCSNQHIPPDRHPENASSRPSYIIHWSWLNTGTHLKRHVIERALNENLWFASVNRLVMSPLFLMNRSVYNALYIKTKLQWKVVSNTAYRYKNMPVYWIVLSPYSWLKSIVYKRKGSEQILWKCG